MKFIINILNRQSIIIIRMSLMIVRQTFNTDRNKYDIELSDDNIIKISKSLLLNYSIDHDKIKKDDVKEKLEDRRLTESDDETVNTIDKVLGRLQTESFNELNLYKLIKLSDSL